MIVLSPSLSLLYSLTLSPPLGFKGPAFSLDRGGQGQGRGYKGYLHGLDPGAILGICIEHILDLPALVLARRELRHMVTPSTAAAAATTVVSVATFATTQRCDLATNAVALATAPIILVW